MKLYKIILLCIAALILAVTPVVIAENAISRNGNDTVLFAKTENGEYELISTEEKTTYRDLIQKYAPEYLPGDYLLDAEHSMFELSDETFPAGGGIYAGQTMTDAAVSLFADKAPGKKINDVWVTVKSGDSYYHIGGVYGGIPFRCSISDFTRDGEKIIGVIKLMFDRTGKLGEAVEHWTAVRDTLISQIGSPVCELSEGVYDDNFFAGLSAEEILAVEGLQRVAVSWGQV